MPVYEYECSKCGVIEVMQKITDKPLKRCPNCRGSIRKLVSQSSFQLKGSGWYVTDYKKGNGGGNGRKKEGTEPAKVERAKTECCKESSVEK